MANTDLMYKRILVILVLGSISLKMAAQAGNLTVMGTSPDLHLQHTVAPKENWYSVGRIYNISPKEIAPFNGLNLESPLSIGQQIKIPLTASNFSQNGDKMEDEVYVPLYHTVQEKEWMYRISTTYNKVPIENLERWNNVNKDQVKPGMRLIIGYLKVKKDQSVLAGKSVTPVNNPPVAIKQEEKKAEPLIVQQENKPDIQTQPAKEIKNEVIKPAEDKTLPVKVAQQPSDVLQEGGFFKTLYEETGRASSGSAGVFKSISGWQDARYYALINNVSTGTIIKVSNPSTGKFVYAKVLGQLPDNKESSGFTVRISDAAASILGADTPKFTVDLKY